MGKHALLSPSSSDRWMACPASVAASIGYEDVPNEAAASGTVSHNIAAGVLIYGLDPMSFVGDTAVEDGFELEIDEERIERVNSYVSFVQAEIARYEAAGAIVSVYIETPLCIDHITGEEGAEGTADVILLAAWPDGGVDIACIDLKDGFKRVSANGNHQLLHYISGAMRKYGLNPNRIRGVIFQPRISNVGDEVEMTLSELRDWEKKAKTQAAHAMRLKAHVEAGGGLKEEDFAPGRHCEYCPHAAECEGLEEAVMKAMGTSVEELEDHGAHAVYMLKGDSRLARLYPLLSIVEDWVSAIRTRTSERLHAGADIPGLKLVLGKKGNRTWVNEEEAEAALKAIRLKVDEMYDKKIISPTTAEKLLMKSSPRNWKKIEPLITRRAASVSVAFADDKREQYIPLRTDSLFDD